MPKGNEITLGYVHDWHRVERRNAAISVPCRKHEFNYFVIKSHDLATVS